MNDEFSINQLVMKTLKSLDIPVYFVAGKENKFPFVVFNVTSERGNLWWEDEEQVTKYSVTINILAKGNYEIYKKQILKLMKEAGFDRYDIPACVYLEDTEVYNQPLEFNYIYEQ